jgi:hypothetical protein
LLEYIKRESERQGKHKKSACQKKNEFDHLTYSTLAKIFYAVFVCERKTGWKLLFFRFLLKEFGTEFGSGVDIGSVDIIFALLLGGDIVGIILFHILFLLLRLVGSKLFGTSDGHGGDHGNLGETSSATFAPVHADDTVQQGHDSNSYSDFHPGTAARHLS